MKGPTLIQYWDQLTSQQRRLIHDLLKAYVAKYNHLPIGMLPFVPTKAVIKLLRSGPLSPWSSYLIEEELGRDARYDAQRVEQSRYRRSTNNDKIDYDLILSIIDPPPAPKPTQLQTLLTAWQAKATGGDDAPL